MPETTTDTKIPFDNGGSLNIPIPDISSFLGGGTTISNSGVFDTPDPDPEYIGNPHKLFSAEDPQSRQPRPGFTSEVYVFDLSKEEQLTEYKNVLDKAGTSRYSKLGYIERHWVESTQSWKVLVELRNNVLVDPDIK